MQVRFRLSVGLLAPLMLWGCTGSPGRPPLGDGGSEPAPQLDTGTEAAAPPDAPLDTATEAAGPPDASSGDDGAVADASDADGPSPVDGPTTVNRRSFVVTSVATAQPDAGSFPSPETHRFTMVLDADRHVAIVGASGWHRVLPFSPSPSGGSLGESFSSRSDGNRAVSITHESVTFSIDGAGTLSWTGQGTGFYTPSNTDVTSVARVSIAWSGAPDTERPVITSPAHGRQISPLESVTLFASEPLPPDTPLILSAAGGFPSIFRGPADQTIAVCCFYAGSGKMWRYDTTYTIDLQGLPTGGVVDFAGNEAAAGSQIFFTTGPAPVLALEDGFESVTGSTFAEAQVLSGASPPVISGTRSLYIPPLASGALNRPKITQLALRLPLAAGDSRVVFSFRRLGQSAGGPDYFVMASEGGQIVSRSLPSNQGENTPATIPGQGEVLLGPLMTADFELPPDASGEITLMRTVGPGPTNFPAPPVAGFIIDDLRAE